MAYLSREFWKSDDDRQRAASAASPVGSELAPGAGSANPVASSGSAEVDPGGSAGAIRSFFDANKDQGARVLGGLADSINQRISDTSGRIEQAPTVSPQIDLLGSPTSKNDIRQYLNDTRTNQINSVISGYNAEQQANADKGKAAAARNTALVQPLQPDVQNLGAGQEGQQSILQSRYGGSGYTPGQSRLDAWLTGSASNAAPSVVGGTLDAYRSLQQNAGTAQQDGALPDWAQWLKEHSV